jgi:2-polyprenyl-6-methoxyphenol hydroxylase-like FAD-dependent oxidoreductase
MAQGHALIVGGSVAGLSCAEALSRHFGRVTVLERDRLHSGSGLRRGVPQASHQHLLLARGQQLLEALFPGLRDELMAHGAQPLDVAGDLAWLTPAGWSPRFRSGITIVPCTRQLLEGCLRERVRANPRVGIRDEQQVVGLLTGSSGRVVGVRARPSGRRELPGERMYADLVVDAAGRGSRLPRWLGELGHRVPEARVVDAHVSYASRAYGGPGALPAGVRGVFIQAAPPASTRGGALLPIEQGRMLLTLIGRGADVPPTDAEGFLAFARSLRSPMIHDAVAALTPLTRPVTSRATENRCYSYERMRDWPAGLVVLGDAAWAFNPVYGQGMSTAALGATALARLVAEVGAAGAPAHTRRFQRRLARLCAGPWMLDTDLDLRVQGVTGPSPGRRIRVRQHYLARVGRLAVERPAVRLALLEVLHLLRGPSSLVRPSISGLVLARAVNACMRRPSYRPETMRTRAAPASRGARDGRRDGPS